MDDFEALGPSLDIKGQERVVKNISRDDRTILSYDADLASHEAKVEMCEFSFIVVDGPGGLIFKAERKTEHRAFPDG